MSVKTEANGGGGRRRGQKTGVGDTNGTNGTNGTISEDTNGQNEPVPLPHVTGNILPLSNVLKFYCQESYKQLTLTIENLSMDVDNDLDVVRKKKFLDVIIGIRQDFIKLYTLVKWSSKSKEVNKLIDLLNWFRNQEFFFDQLCLRLTELNSFGGAKLPNSDLITSLEVLTKGRPQLPSYNYFEDPPISSEKTLQVLKDLNLLLTTRMALSDDIPLEFLQNYIIKDGRIIITIPKRFELTITVGNDEFIEREEDYYKSPFYLIDFKFLFGVVNNEIKSDTITTLPIPFWTKLEEQANMILLKSNIVGLYEFLVKFSTNFKLNLIYQQLKKSVTNIKWNKSLKIKFINSVISINYWKNLLNYIELTIDDDFAINCKWVKNSEQFDHDIQPDNDDFSIDYLLNLVLNKHCELIIGKIVNEIPKSMTKLLNPFQLLLTLSGSKSTILTVDPFSGKINFSNPDNNQSQTMRKINSFNGDEPSFISFIVKNLIDLKLGVISSEINNKLITVEWINNNIIKLKDAEIKKFETHALKIQFFKCKNWPSSWFLAYIINDDFMIEWSVCRIKSIKGEWIVEWCYKLELSSVLNFEFFNDLSGICFKEIINNLIIQELSEKQINFVKISNSAFVEKLGIKENNSNNELMLMIYNNGTFLPVETASNFLLLKAMLKTKEKEKFISLQMFTKVNSNMDDLMKFNIDSLDIKLNKSSGFFEINKEVNVSNLGGKLTDSLFSTLNKFNKLVKIFNELTNNNIEILKFNDMILIKINDIFNKVIIELPNDINSTYTLKMASQEDEKHDQISPIEGDLVLTFLNKLIANNSKIKLIGVINYLNRITPILGSFNHLKSKFNKENNIKLANGLKKLYLDFKIKNLNHFELIFHINFINSGNTKKILKDRIIINIKFKYNKFDQHDPLNLVVSLIDNINVKNLKYKKLFESIFKRLNQNENIVNLNYDFIVTLNLVDEFLDEICGCFLNFIETVPL